MSSPAARTTRRAATPGSTGPTPYEGGPCDDRPTTPWSLRDLPHLRRGRRGRSGLLRVLRCGALRRRRRGRRTGAGRAHRGRAGRPDRATRPTSRSAPAADPLVPAALCLACGSDVGEDGYCTVCGTKAPIPRDHYVEQPAGWVAAVCDRGIKHHRNEDATAVAADPTPGSGPCSWSATASRPPPTPTSPRWPRPGGPATCWWRCDRPASTTRRAGPGDRRRARERGGPGQRRRARRDPRRGPERRGLHLRGRGGRGRPRRLRQRR